MNRLQCSSERLDHFNCPLCSQATTQHLPNCDRFTQQSSKGLKVQVSASNTNQISKALALQMSDMAPSTTSPTPSSASTHIRPPVNTKKHPASLSPAQKPTKRGQQLSNPTMPATDSPQIQPARYQPYPSLPYGGTVDQTRPFIGLTDPSAGGQVTPGQGLVDPTFWPARFPGPQSYPLPLDLWAATTCLLSGNTATRMIGGLPLSVSSQDAPFDFFLPQHSTPSPNSLPTPSATLQLPMNAAHTPNFADPSGLETAPTLINNHPVSSCSTDRQVSPLPLISELFPSEHQLAIDLSVPRDNMKWVEWEHQLIMSCLLGPQTSPATIMQLMHMPPRACTKESLAELLPLFWNISIVSFRNAHGVKPISQQWLQLLGLFNEIEKFAIHFGLDLNSPEFDSIPVLVNRIVAIWKHHIPEGEGWGKLKLTDIATWTYDPRNGWLAIITISGMI